jgi:hypothetical protein
MIRTLLALILIVSLVPTPAPAGEDRTPQDFPETFAIVPANGGFGHACAVNKAIVTNRHNVLPRGWKEGYEVHPSYYRYEFINGRAGYGKSLRISRYADVAELKLDIPASQYGVLAANGPERGEKVWWVEYDFRKQDKAFFPRVRSAKVTTSFAGQVILAGEIVPGASGGCAYNEAGEVIGLMTFGFGTDDGRPSAGVVGLWGQWWKDVRS